jgi:hypothetical protein
VSGLSGERCATLPLGEVLFQVFFRAGVSGGHIGHYNFTKMIRGQCRSQ